MSFSSSTFFATRDQAAERRRKIVGTTNLTPQPMQTSRINPALLRFEIPDFASLSHERGNFVEPTPIRIRNRKMVPKRCGFRSNVAYGFMGHSRESILENGLEDDGSLVVDVAVEFWAKQPQSVLWDSNKKRKHSAETQSLITNDNLTTDLFRSRPFADLSF